MSDDLFPTRTRLALLVAVDHQRVYRTGAGYILRRGSGDAPNRRADSAIREVESAGWVRLGRDGGTYELTDEGRTVLQRGAR